VEEYFSRPSLFPRSADQADLFPVFQARRFPGASWAFAEVGFVIVRVSL
jgi:hypothetical protein